MKRGYSIMEVLVAVVLLAIALPGLVRWVTASRHTQNASFRSEQATEFTQYVMDSLRELPRISRTERPSPDTFVKDGRTYRVTWKYLASPAYAPGDKRPGAAFVQVDWTAGSAARTSRLLGVLP